MPGQQLKDAFMNNLLFTLFIAKKEIEVNQEKIDYINYVYNKEITYWKKAALERVLNESEE